MKTALHALIFFVFLNSFSIKAQQLEWAKQYGTDNSQHIISMAVDNEGNAYILGQTNNKITDLDLGPGTFILDHPSTYTSGFDIDLFLVKLDSDGNFEWGKGLATKFSESNQAINVKIGEDGSIFTAIKMYDYPYVNASLVIHQFSSSGTLLFTKTINNENGISNALFNCSSFDIDDEGNMFTCGYFFNTISFDPQNPQFDLISSTIGTFVMKLNSLGEIVWTKTLLHEQNFWDYRNLIVRPDGQLNLLITRIIATQPIQTLYKIDSGSNAILWQKEFINQIPMDFKIAPNGEIFILSWVGMGTFDVDPGPGLQMVTNTDDSNMYTLWLNPEGEFNEVQLYNYEWNTFRVGRIFIDRNNDYYLFGPYNYGADLDLDFDLSENEFHLNDPPPSGLDALDDYGVIIKYSSNHDFTTAFAIRGWYTIGICDIDVHEDKLYLAGTVNHLAEIQPGPGQYYIDATYNGLMATDGFVAKYDNCSLSPPQGDIDQYFCQGQNSKISDLKPNAQNIAWYDTPASSTPLASTTSLIDGQIYYASRITNCGISDRLAVTVHINTVPSAPLAANQQFCATANPTVENLTATGTDIKWYTNNTSTTSLEATATLSNGQYYATQTTNGCESPRTVITVTIITTPDPTAAPSQSYCINANAIVSSLTVDGTDIKIYSDATSVTPLADTTSLQSQSYYATQTLNNCESNRVAIAVTINSTPVPTANATQIFCAGDSPVISNLSVSGENIKWYDAITGGNLLAANTPLMNNTVYYASQTINGCESITRCAVTTTIDNANIPAKNHEAHFCDNNNDGTETINLNDYNSYLLSSIVTGYNFTYYHTENGAENKIITDKINTPENLQINTGAIFVFARIESPGGCFKIVTLKLELAQPTPPVLSDSVYYICEGNSLVIKPNSGFSDFNWSNGSKSKNFTVSQPGNYSVTALYDHGGILCKTTFNFTITALPETYITEVLTTDWTDDDNAITIVTSPSNENEYSIDGIHYQQDNHFNNLLPGIYTIYVRSIDGCGYDTREVLLLNYPKFFTPNNDGVNDYWKIDSSFFENDLEITIFDRYGKIIKGFKNSDAGWDGNFHNKALPATDYWFIVKRAGKQYKGHFSLIR